MSTILFNKTFDSEPILNLNNNWSDPELTLEIVNSKLKGLETVALNDHRIIAGSWNAEYLWQAKANHFITSYLQILKRHHILALQEVSAAGLSVLSSASNYNYFVCSPNSRGQAVGFMVHPRFVVTGAQEYMEVANVFNIHDLRPALRIDLEDTITNIQFTMITIHLKSMLGGLPSTSIVRKKQLEKLLISCNDIQNPLIIVGDFNCFLDLSEDISSLIANGFVLANPGNHTSTQKHGGRLDGLMYKNCNASLVPKHYSIRNFWQAGIAGRSLSDHGMLTWKLTNPKLGFKALDQLN